MKKFFVLVLVSSTMIAGCGKDEVSFSDEGQALQDNAATPVAVPVLPATPAIAEAPATRCAITVFDRNRISQDQVWSARSGSTDAALLAKIEATRLTYYPVCLGPQDEGEWEVDDSLIDDTDKGREVFLKGLISNDPARFSVRFFYLGKQLLPTSGSILVGRNEAAIAESANYIYEIRCNLTASECDPAAYSSKYPRR
ncbi:MAG: hypothetical protein A2X94_00620 [Bdellovibrionales bacterium GWB1_55_8]|nr:MAG: hypothetical protein A2X94_00620 [Bdellovibrionales bacterium GWB1_55_8]